MPKRSGILDVFGGDDVVNNAPIKSYEVTRDGFTVTLPDGQVWQQTDDDAAKNPVRWRQPASSMRVTIRQGALHSFNLVLNDENQHHKVRRVR
jgi:RecB family endonuclease NucS